MIGWGARFWPIFLLSAAVVGVGAEIVALVTDARNTLSFWVWNELNVQRNTLPWDWSATQFLIFGLWIVTATWLTFHFFFHRFT